MELFKPLRDRWHDWQSRSESDQLPSNRQQLNVPGPIPKPVTLPGLALMRGGRGSLRQPRLGLRNPQPAPSEETTNNVHIHIPPNTQNSLSNTTRPKPSTAKANNAPSANKPEAPQQHTPMTASAVDETTLPIGDDIDQTFEGLRQPNPDSYHIPSAHPQGSQKQTSHTLVDDTTLREYCSGFFVDLMAADKHPELQARYQQKRALINKFLISLNMRERHVAVDFVMASKTKRQNATVATILITCLNDDQRKKIQSGLHKQRNVMPEGFDIRIVVQRTVLSSRMISTPSKPGNYARKIVMASFAGDPGTMCGILGHFLDFGPETYFTLGGTIIVDGGVYILTTAHSLFSKSADAEERPHAEGENSIFTSLRL